MDLFKKLIPQSIKNIYHLSQAVLANFMYGWPSKSIKVIGVTGTNGKTTTVQMITKILEEAPVKPDGHGARRRVALASTINFKIAEKEWVNKTKFTTLSAFQVQKFILDAVKAGCEYLVLETSSHSLDQYRVWGVDYQTAVITNVTREHLDYHKTMEEYRRAKLKLFKKTKIAIVNLDMERPEEYLDCKAENIFGYSLQIPNSKFQIPNKYQIPNSKFQTIIAESVEERMNYSKFEIRNSKFALNLPGIFNIENSLAAICVGLAENISLETSAKALAKIQGVPGRMEHVPNNKGLNIIIDYAVTPDSLEKLYALVDQIKRHPELVSGSSGDSEMLNQVQHDNRRGSTKIIAVFGACGERDRGKRPLMGEIVSCYADHIILTNEDPYNENPIAIINQVFSGVVGYEANDDFTKSQIPNPKSQINLNNQKPKSKIEGINVFRILDRREAIKKALQLAKAGDYVMVTGKGAEEIMAVGNERIPWNDKNVILEELKKLP